MGPTLIATVDVGIADWSSLSAAVGLVKVWSSVLTPDRSGVTPAASFLISG